MSSSSETNKVMSEETDFERKLSFLHNYNLCSEYVALLDGNPGKLSHVWTVLLVASRMKKRVDSLLEFQKDSTGSEEEMQALSTCSQKQEELLTRWNVKDAEAMSGQWKEEEEEEEGVCLARESKELLQTIKPFLKTIESLEAKHPNLDIQAEPPKRSISFAINPASAHAVKVDENGDVTIDFFGPPSNNG